MMVREPRSFSVRLAGGIRRSTVSSPPGVSLPLAGVLATISTLLVASAVSVMLGVVRALTWWSGARR